MPFVSVTRLRVESLFFLIPFMRANEASVKEIKVSKGLLKGKELIDNKKGDISVALCTLAPLTDERCSLNSLIEFVTIRKLKW